MKLVAAIIISLLFVLSAFAAKSWKFYNPDGHMNPAQLHNGDKQSRVGNIWLWKRCDEHPYALTIRFDNMRDHDAFQAAIPTLDGGYMTVTQPENNPSDLIVNVGHSNEGRPEDAARWVRVLMAIHAIDPFTTEAMDALEGLLGITLARDGVFNEQELEEWDTVEEVAPVLPGLNETWQDRALDFGRAGRHFTGASSSSFPQ